MSEFFIPGNVPSQKNSKVIGSVGPRCPKCKKGKFPKLFSSKNCREWAKAAKKYFNLQRDEFWEVTEELSFPIKIKFKFYRKSRHRFDYTNASEIVLDQMVHNEWIEDDNADIIIPSFEPYEYNKERPGVLITVI
jgi:hypothetical protein